MSYSVRASASFRRLQDRFGTVSATLHREGSSFDPATRAVSGSATSDSVSITPPSMNRSKYPGGMAVDSGGLICYLSASDPGLSITPQSGDTLTIGSASYLLGDGSGPVYGGETVIAYRLELNKTGSG